ncbi:hypothetical protein [Cronobacter sakazakii]|uniref:hypothetical protein n=1 Tax=Cronobacter sakazakii TaxID=28141 RepID=UPI000AA53B6A|nr:hypothetical protein [Cronobacter sakazakii]EMC4369449.1 hypothetical protein [Cronobacter sakazakii]
MNYEKTKELVKSGHQLVVLLGKQNGMHEAASLVQRMAGQLDVLIAVLREKTKQCDQLAAENAALNNRMQKLIQIINNADNSYCMCGEAMETHAHGGCGHPTGMFDYHYNAWLEADTETPATDAFLRKVRAEAILFASYHLPDGGKYQDSIQALAQEVLDGYTQVSFPVQQQRQGGAA